MSNRYLVANYDNRLRIKPLTKFLLRYHVTTVDGRLCLSTFFGQNADAPRDKFGYTAYVSELERLAQRAAHRIAENFR